ncbi:MAG: hypothetical protein IPL39_12465 [Opitutaceae bacterium]|nr:hypothetical protein [Opitutaceae bacterium]
MIALVLVAAGALGWGWWQHNLRLRAQADVVQLQGRLAELARQPVAPPTVAPVVSVATEAAGRRPPTSGPEEHERRGRPGRFARVMAELSSDPEIGPLMLNQRKRVVATRYAALLAQLGLSPAQTEELKTLLAEKQLSRTEARSMARSQGLGRDEAQEMARLADAESDAALKAMLGANSFGQLQDFDRTFAQRTTVRSLAERLSYVGAPIPTAQQEQLIQILATNAAAERGSDPGSGPFDPAGRPAGAMPFPGGELAEADTPDHVAAKAATDAAALQQASSLLTPAQLAVLQQMQQEENEQMRLNVLTRQRLRQARHEGGGG